MTTKMQTLRCLIREIIKRAIVPCHKNIRFSTIERRLLYVPRRHAPIVRVPITFSGVDLTRLHSSDKSRHSNKHLPNSTTIITQSHTTRTRTRDHAPNTNTHTSQGFEPEQQISIIYRAYTYNPICRSAEVARLAATAVCPQRCQTEKPPATTTHNCR